MFFYSIMLITRLFRFSIAVLVAWSGMSNTSVTVANKSVHFLFDTDLVKHSIPILSLQPLQLPMPEARSISHPTCFFTSHWTDITGICCHRGFAWSRHVSVDDSLRVFNRINQVCCCATRTHRPHFRSLSG